MATAHDRPSEMIAPPSGNGAVATGRFDLLSDLLRTVKLKGAQFFLVDATSPWCVDIPAAAEFSRIIMPRARHVISYHIVVEGAGLAAVPGNDPVGIESGDILVFPHGDPYLMASASDVPPELDREETLQFFRDLADGTLPFVIPEGGGQPPGAKFICGFLGCDPVTLNPLFGSLPRLLHIRRPNAKTEDLLDRLIDLTIAESRDPRAGSETIRIGLSEVMFVELLRRHLETLPAGEYGWLAGFRDPIVGRVLMLLHAEPARGWTLGSLARSAGVSRSVLAKQFAEVTGETPMRYLALWRMQLAARLLVDGNDKIAAIAEQVGFRSEAAFSRAFKKTVGLSPAAWRQGAAQRD